jgi:hypothetical protein
MTSDDIREAVARYEMVNFQLVRLKAGGKTPISQKGWQNAAPKASEFLRDENVGVQLGSKSGHLVDIDLDIPEARALAGLKCFFGHLPAFRRSSLPPDEPGHRLESAATLQTKLNNSALPKRASWRQSKVST